MLTNYQQQIFRRSLSHSNSNILTIRGFAGSGKTHTVIEIIKAKVKRNEKILILAPTAAALGVIKKKIKDSVQSQYIKFRTLTSLLRTPVEVFSIQNSNKDTLFKTPLNQKGVEKLQQFMSKLKATPEDYDAIKEYEKIIPYDYETGARNVKTIEYDIDLNQISALFNKKLGVTAKNLSISTEFILDDIQIISKQLEKFDCLIIDEMSMVDQEDTHHLVQAIERLSNPLLGTQSLQAIFVGDRSQLQPVKGSINHYMKQQPDEIDTFELVDILRSSDDIAQLGHLINKGNNIFRLQKAYSDQIKRYDENIDTFINHHIDEIVNSDITITFTNRFVDKINQAVRQHLGYAQSSLVEDESLMVTENTYAKTPDSNDIIFANSESVKINKIYSKAETAEMLENKSRNNAFQQAFHNQYAREYLIDALQINEAGHFTLVKVQSLDNQSEPRLMWIPKDLKYNKRDLQFRRRYKALNNLAQYNHGEIPVLNAKYGYARTIHKAQGSEWNSVNVLLTERDVKTHPESKQLLYTAVTRAKENLMVYLIK